MATLLEVFKTDLVHKSDFLKSATGDIGKISGLENYKNALFHRLVTTPGSLIHRPLYGVGVKEFQNAPPTLANQRKLAGRINEQFMQDPRTEKVVSVAINFNATSPERMVITVRVKPKGYDEATLTFIPFGDTV
jgi:phage baseplate assembly protein W